MSARGVKYKALKKHWYYRLYVWARYWLGETYWCAGTGGCGNTETRPKRFKYSGPWCSRCHGRVYRVPEVAWRVW
jgi:hypothetical protein